jgi:predicted outer membrane repeat protein
MLAALGLGGATGVAVANTYVVNTTGDPGPMGTQSLRQAIVTANATSGNTIQFDAALVGSTITLSENYGNITVTKPMTISGPGADKLTISGNDAVRIFLLSSTTGQVAISGLTLTHGYTAPPLAGAAIAAFFSPVSVDHCVITGNASKAGAGIFAYNSSLSVSNSRVTGNSAIYSGGGIVATCPGACSAVLNVSQSTISGNFAGQSGAGIYAYKQQGISVTESLISGNRNFAPSGQAGGGMFIYATQTMPTITNSTLAGNYSYNRGGGIYADTATVLFSTIAGNSTHNADSNGLDARAGGAITLQDSILAKNFSGNGTVDVTGSLTANFTLIGNSGSATVGGTSKLIGLDPLLGSLADHGGPTLTMVPVAASPAVNAGEAVSATIDQRGLTRPVGAKADMGAVERQAIEDIIFRDGFNFQ